MSRVKVIGGIGISSVTGARYIDMSSTYKGSNSSFAGTQPATPPDDSEITANGKPWANWGTDNLLPVKMTDDIEACGVLNAGIDVKARFGMGKGIWPVYTERKGDGSEVITKVVEDPIITDWLEESNDFHSCFGWFKDLIGFGQGQARFVLTRDRKKIAYVQRDDISECRYEKMDKYGTMKNVYMSADWANVSSYPSDKVIKIPLLPFNGTVQNLTDRTSGFEFAMRLVYPTWRRRYYTLPAWLAAYKWVQIAKGVPEMKAALFENNMRLKYMVVIYEKYWETAYGSETWENYDEGEKEQKRSDLYDEIDKFLVGSENAYKSIYVDGYTTIDGSKFQNIDIIPIKDDTKNGELLPDASAANFEILFALSINPALIGSHGVTTSGYGGGAGSGSDIREAGLYEIIKQEFERRYLSRVFNIVKQYNGWDPRIKFVFPNMVLTTLDTGGQTKSVVGAPTPGENTDKSKKAA
jgi:hypothetical protein